MQYHTSSSKQTQKIAADIAQDFKNAGGIITLSGPLGAGKTTFVQGFASALGITHPITSPTFVIARQYPIPNSNHALHHVDLYRLEDESDLSTLGLSEIFNDSRNVVLVEWPERLGKINRQKLLRIEIRKISPKERLIEVAESS